MTDIILVGASGAMGKTVADVCKDNDNYKIIAGIAEESYDKGDFKIYDDFAKIDGKADVIIDFSSPKALDDIIDYGLKTKTNIILATTGYSESDEEKIKEASKEIAIVKSGNYSIGINIMTNVAREMAKLLDGFDIEIIEAHHNNKKDAPSGTAKMLFDAVNEGRDNKLYKNEDRFDQTKARDENEVGMSSVRAGTITGDHVVVFAGEDEVLSIQHSAGSKKIFAIGALKAADFINEKSSGLYDLDDVLETKEN